MKSSELGKQNFKNLSDSIASTLGREVAATYYRPFQNNINNAAGGKLYEQYISYRKTLASRGVIQLRPRAACSLPAVVNLDAQTSDESALVILRNYIDVDSETLIDAWESSFNYRRSIKNLSDLMALVVALKEPTGYRLVILLVTFKCKNIFKLLLFSANVGLYNSSWDRVFIQFSS